MKGISEKCTVWDEHIYRSRGLNDPSGARTYQVMWKGGE